MIARPSAYQVGARNLASSSKPRTSITTNFWNRKTFGALGRYPQEGTHHVGQQRWNWCYGRPRRRYHRNRSRRRTSFCYRHDWVKFLDSEARTAEDHDQINLLVQFYHQPKRAYEILLGFIGCSQHSRNYRAIGRVAPSNGYKF
jgi:hypothetical protein